jgi:hypothetical protein
MDCLVALADLRSIVAALLIGVITSSDSLMDFPEMPTEEILLLSMKCQLLVNDLWGIQKRPRKILAGIRPEGI